MDHPLATRAAGCVPSSAQTRVEVENEAKERAAVTRSQNAMYVLPHDAAASDEFLATWVQRLDQSAAATQLLVITSDSEAAASLAAAVVRLANSGEIAVVPVASPRRAERRVRTGAHVVIGAAGDLLALVRSSALKLGDVRAVIVAWADELPASDSDALEALFAEVPKTAARTVVATEASESVEALVERYARRPRRNVAADAGDGAAVSVSFLTTAAAGRAAALRRVIDALDPTVARVHVRNDDSERAARQALAAMGHTGGDPAVTVTRNDGGEGEGGVADLAVLFDMPASSDALSAVAASARRTVVLLQPRQLPSLRRLARGGAVSPVALPENAARGQQEVAALRNALVAELAAGGIGRELLVLEPLLEEHDPMELAAAALRLAGRSRPGAAAGAAAPNAASAQGPAGPMTKVFVNVGEMDNARPSDIVAAIINEGGVSRDQVGRIDVRDKHSVVEIEEGVAEQVIERLTGAAIRGRRVQARVDQERPRGDRPERGGPRGAERGARPSRDAGDRPRSRGFDRDRAPSRGFERDRPPARTFDRPTRGGSGADRPSRPPRDRDDRPAGNRGGFGSRDSGGRESGGRGGFGGRDSGSRGPARPGRPRRGDA